jgi:cyclase
MMTTSQPVPTSEHFTLERLTDGVYAAIATAGGGAVCNAGIVDLGDESLVFDTLQTPAAADDLLAACRALTGRDPAYVVNSHWHGDHVHGNMVFGPHAEIIATGRTRELMATLAAAEIAEDRDGIEAFIASQEARLGAETDDGKRRELELRLRANRTYAACLPTLELRLPDRTFDGALGLGGRRRSAQLDSFGGGHTASDAWLYLPDDRILFFGDLLFVNVHPYLPDGDPDEWIAHLQRMDAYDVARAIPGHGPVGTLADVPLIGDYIAVCQRIVSDARAAGKTLDETLQTPVPAAFAHWEYDAFFGANLRFLYQRQQPQVAG